MTALYDDDVVPVPGQLLLPKMPSEKALFRLQPVRRPNGGSYRPRKAPEALLLGYDDGVEGVAVMRTHNADLARRLALQALAKYDPRCDWELNATQLVWGRWRPDQRAENSTWVDQPDGTSGTPAVFFTVEER